MQFLIVPLMTLTTLLVVGCSSSANDPALTLHTDKSAEQYVDCVVPKLQQDNLDPVVSRDGRSLRIVLSSKITVDKVLETYRAEDGSKVYLYDRQLLASKLLPGSLERAAMECL